MNMADSIIGRLQTPADADGNRTDVNLLTSSDAVVLTDGSTLTDAIDTLSLNVSSAKPAHAGTWIQVLSTESGTETVTE